MMHDYNYLSLLLSTLQMITKTERHASRLRCLRVANQGGTAGAPLVPLVGEGFFNVKMYAKERTHEDKTALSRKQLHI
jgi:pyrroline-5-carboxylate reductase